MINEILMAIIQGVAEFLPVSSSAHLAIFLNFVDKPSLSLISLFNLISLFAVVLFLRKEIYRLITFEKRYRKMWLYLIMGTLPAAIAGFLLKDLVEGFLTSFLFLGIFFIFTSMILFLTKFSHESKDMTWKIALFVGLFHVFAIFPGISRSGTTIAAALFLGLKREEAFKFSFLLSIPITIVAAMWEMTNTGFEALNISLIIPLIICFIFSFIFIHIYWYIVKKNKLWLFSFYLITVGIISLIFHYFL